MTCGPLSWRSWPLATSAAVLLRRWARDGEPDLDDAIRLTRAVGAGEPDGVNGRDLRLWPTPAWRAIDLGYAYLERSRLQSTDDDLLAARVILRGAVGAAHQPRIWPSAAPVSAENPVISCDLGILAD